MTFYKADEPLQVPDKLRALIGERVAALPVDVRATLLLAATAARPTRELLAACDPQADRLIAAAVDAGVVRSSPDGAVRFAHPLLAEIVYADATAADRRAAHRAIADHLDDVVERARQRALGNPERDAAPVGQVRGKQSHPALPASQRPQPGRARAHLRCFGSLLTFPHDFVQEGQERDPGGWAAAHLRD